MTLLSWWRSRLPREQWSLAGGGVTLSLILIYLLLEPGLEERRRLAAAIPALQQDLAWMQDHLEEVRRAQADGQGENDVVARPILTPALVEASLQRQGLAQQVSDLRPGQDRGVRLTFEAVSYASLMELLHRLRQENGARVSRATFRRSEEQAGAVTADLLLVSSNPP